MQQKLLLALGMTLLTAATVYLQVESPVTNESLINEFAQWKQSNNRKYGMAEENHRFRIFSTNYAIVNEHNARFAAGLETFTLDLNSFADMTNEEFSAQYLSYNKGASKGIVSTYHAQGIQVPTEVDHRTTGAVSDVKNQGSCGSCWAFSAVAALEGALRQAGNKDLELSEQELVDCATGLPDYESEGCNGGFMQDGFKYAAKSGIAARSEYAYTGVDGQCNASKTKTRFQTKSFVQVTQGDAKAYVEAAASHPMAIAINAGGIYFQLYKKGIYTKPCDGSEEALNHGVTNVGYGVDFYLIKNSWGNGWGESGYIRFGRIDKPEGQCGAQQDVSYPTV